MRSGDLRRRMTIQTRTATTDPLGGQLQIWTDFVANVPAQIRALSSAEIFTAQSVNSKVTHEITIRYMAGITSAMRGVYSGRYFNFSTPINVDERNIELVIQATEGLNDG